MTPSRRSFLTGLGATLAVAATPKAALLRSSALVPPAEIDFNELLARRVAEAYKILQRNQAESVFNYGSGGMGLQSLVRDDSYPFRQIATAIVCETKRPI